MITPVAFEILFDTCKIWSFQFNFSSIMIPKNLGFVTSVIELFSIFIVNFALHLFRMNSMHWVLSTFNVNLFTFSHFAISFNSVFSIHSISSRFFPFWNKFESSAKKIGIVYLQTLARSFIYTKNNKGPKMDPWGTPHLMFINLYCSLLYVTYCFRFIK